jgi:O-antigen ligase
MRWYGMTPGTTRTGPGRLGTGGRPGLVPPWALLPPAAAGVVLLVVTRSWHALGVLLMAGLALLAVSGPATTVVLIPISLLTGLLLPGEQAVTLAATAVVALSVAALVPAGRRPVRGPHAVIGILVLVLLAAFLLPAVHVPAPPDRTADLIGLLAGLALLAAVVASPPPPGTVARVTAAAGGVAAALVLTIGDRPDGRLDGLGLNPNFLGALLVLPLVAAAGLAWRHRRPAWLLPAGVCLAAVAATQSRGAFLAAAVGVSVVLLQGRRRGLWFLVIAGVTTVGLVFPRAIDAAERLVVGGRQAAELSQDSAIRERVAWFAARVAAGHPLRGIGYGLFAPYAERPSGLGLSIATHNDLLRLAAEAGLPALGAFLLLLWLGLRRPVSGDLAITRAIAVAYAAGLLFANELASLLVSMAFWLSLGCLLAAAHHQTDATQKAVSR